ncbi:hypothetical protein SAMN05444285_1208 [Draconibacterium orientale]|uniref:Uncharacterized protein n=1 Tax=Draconibacterium orientale TaxID=1168034 RepID=X5DNV6_9BACT|nr:hypothetical protein FH5T_19745 [Draconibacterium orientale]SET68882.1 hypothetical protein SAMN05444285_1208 [Draconibacterium orientale]
MILPFWLSPFSLKKGKILKGSFCGKDLQRPIFKRSPLVSGDADKQRGKSLSGDLVVTSF